MELMCLNYINIFYSFISKLIVQRLFALCSAVLSNIPYPLFDSLSILTRQLTYTNALLPNISETNYNSLPQVYNKIDQISIEEVDRLARMPNSIVVRFAYSTASISYFLFIQRVTGLYSTLPVAT